MKHAWNQILALFGMDGVEDYAARLNELDAQLWDLVRTRGASLSRWQLQGYVWARARGTYLDDRDRLSQQLVTDLTLRFADRLAASRTTPVRQAA